MTIDLDPVLKLSNQDLNNDNFVEVIIMGDDGETISNLISIDDLLAAVEAFHRIRVFNYQRDQRYDSKM